MALFAPGIAVHAWARFESKTRAFTATGLLLALGIAATAFWRPG